MIFIKAGLLETFGMLQNSRWSKWCLELSRAWNKYCITEAGNGHCRFLYDITYVGDSNTYKANNYVLRRFSISCVGLIITFVKFTNSRIGHTVRHVRDNMLHLWSDNSVTGDDYQLSSVGPTNLTHLPLGKMATISKTIFSYAFSWMKILYFDSIFIEVCS